MGRERRHQATLLDNSLHILAGNNICRMVNHFEPRVGAIPCTKYHSIFVCRYVQNCPSSLLMVSLYKNTLCSILPVGPQPNQGLSHRTGTTMMLADQRPPVDVILFVAFPEALAVVLHPVHGCLHAHLEIPGERTDRHGVATSE